MAHFAEIDTRSSTVLRVIVIPDSEENRGSDFINNDLGIIGTWVQTSYNSRNGKRVDPDTGEVTGDNHFRYNYAGVGFTWNENLGEDGAFIPPKPEGMDSWVVDPVTAIWIPPLPMPEEGNWVWDEGTVSWVAIPETE